MLPTPERHANCTSYCRSDLFGLPASRPGGQRRSGICSSRCWSRSCPPLCGRGWSQAGPDWKNIQRISRRLRAGLSDPFWPFWDQARSGALL